MNRMIISMEGKNNNKNFCYSSNFDKMYHLKVNLIFYDSYSADIYSSPTYLEYCDTGCQLDSVLLTDSIILVIGSR